MDQSMVKRGIGAVVLAIIAALLLGYLLNGKNRERQDVVGMEMPSATDMNIPDLGGNADANSDIAIVGDTANSINNAANNAAEGMQNAVVASADAVNNTVSNAATNTQEQIVEYNNDTNNPGFSIRPANNNETREITENQAGNDNQGGGSAAIAYSTDPVDEVIASSSKPAVKKATKKTFKPRIVEEKRKPKKKATHKKAPKTANKVAKKAAAKPQQTAAAKAPATPEKTVKPQTALDSKPLGKYSIQLLATSSQSRAGKLANTMKSEGYKVFVTKTQSDNKILYRVRVGGHGDRDEAVKAQDSMKRRYEKNFFVQNSLVVSN